MPTITIEPLSREAFAPFGQVIETADANHYPINKGMTERFHDLARVELAGVHARPLISIFKGQPYRLPLKLEMVDGSKEMIVRLGPNVHADEVPQAVVPARAWQAAETAGV